MTVRFIPELAGIVPYQPGLPIEVVQRRFGLEQVVKLASNEYPLPPFPEVKAVVMEALDRLQRYPDGFSTDLRVALAATTTAAPSRSPSVVARASFSICSQTPCWSAATRSCSPRRRSPRTATSSISRGSARGGAAGGLQTHDLEAMAAAVTPRTKMVFVCNPNNPTGTYVPAAGDRPTSSSAVPDDVLVVIDEAYREFVTAPDRAGHPRRSRRRTTTSSSCARSRRSTASAVCAIGYGLCADRRSRQAIDKVRQPFNVNLARRRSPRSKRCKHQDQVAERRDCKRRRCATTWSSGFGGLGRAIVPARRTSCSSTSRTCADPQDKVCGTLAARGGHRPRRQPPGMSRVGAGSASAQSRRSTSSSRSWRSLEVERAEAPEREGRA